MANKHKGSSFKDYLHHNLQDDDMVFLHIKNALENLTLNKNDGYHYLIEAIHDVARARGKSELAEKAKITRQSLYKILNKDSIPSIQNIMAILHAIGLRFSVQRINEVITDDISASVLDVAQYTASLLPRNSTCMKLQKIVYYAQVESLVHHNKPLFGEKIQAWPAGPVVYELFRAHKGLKHINDHAFGDSKNLSLEQKACVNWAIEKYGNLDGDILSHLTHLEAPWKETRGKLPPEAPSTKEITHEKIRTYYTTLPDYTKLDENILLRQKTP